MKMRKTVAAAVLSISLGSAALAAITGGFDYDLYREVVAGAESGRSYSVLNLVTGKAAGAYQFLPATLGDLGYVYSSTGSWDWDSVGWTTKSVAMGVSSLDDFLNTSAGHDLQDQAFDDFTDRNWNALSSTSKSYLGKTVSGVLVTEGGLLSGAHFLGASGMNNFVSAGFTGANLSNLSTILAQNFPSNPTLERLDRYVMSRLVKGAAANGGISGASGYGSASGSSSYSASDVAEEAASNAQMASGVCMSYPIMTQAGARVSSPYGVDRTGRASAGWHQGLDMVNSAGRGDPIYAGVNGTVVVAGSGSGGNRVVIETSDGTQRFVFMHLDSIHRDVRRVGTVVTPDTMIGTMGDSGSEGSVHLHLGTLLTGEKLQGAGMESRIWESPGGWTGSKSASPLTADQVSSALPSTYYFVNPEPFLPSRIEFPADLAADYADQGISRPDGMTLSNTCSVSAGLSSDRVGSSYGGVGAGALADNPIGHMSDVGYAADMAMGELRDAMVDIAKISADEFNANRLYLEDHRTPAAVMGTLISEGQK